MPNDFTSNPIKIDTTFTNDYTPAAGEVQLPLAITKIIWYNPTAAGDLAVVNGKGNFDLKWKGRAEAANGTQVHNFIPPLRARTINVPTLGSGELLIYLDR